MSGKIPKEAGALEKAAGDPCVQAQRFELEAIEGFGTSGIIFRNPCLGKMSMVVMFKVGKIGKNTR